MTIPNLNFQLPKIKFPPPISTPILRDSSSCQSQSQTQKGDNNKNFIFESFSHSDIEISRSCIKTSSARYSIIPWNFTIII